MRLADDRRARVPFALVAVLLLVGSATMAATLRGRAPGGADPDAEAAIHRASASTRTALSSAVERAATRAAQDPVTRPANTTYGRVLGDPDGDASREATVLRGLQDGENFSTFVGAPNSYVRDAWRTLDERDPFWDYLRLRVYLAVREAFSRVEERVDDVRARPSLPGIENASQLRSRLDRVSLTPVNGSLRVRVENVTITARRGDELILHENRTYTVTVETPVVELHRRVRAFEQRLNSGPVAGPGLGQRLTGWLYSVAWARGYAQYAGAPIQNVVANRHVEVLTNEAVLDSQEAAFGRRDPAGARALDRATALVGTYDLVGAVDVGAGGWTKTVLGGYATRASEATLPASVDFSPSIDPANATGPSASVVPENSTGPPPAVNLSTASDLPASVDVPDPPGPDDTMTVGINRTADFAFVDLVDEHRSNAVPDTMGTPPLDRVDRLVSSGQNRSLREQVRSWYAARARLAASVETVRDDPRPSLDPPGEDWTLVGERTVTNTSVVRGAFGGVDVPDGWTINGTYGRVVSHTHTLTRTWRAGDATGNATADTLTRTLRWSEVYRVDIAVLVDHDPDTPAPDRPVVHRYERGGPLDGVNFDGVPGLARRQLVADRDGADALAQRAVAGDLDTAPVTFHPDLPANVTDWVYRDLMALRERVRNVTARVRRGGVVTSVNPPAELLERVEENRTALVDAPAAYRSVADRARVAARAAYVDRVEAILDARADRMTDLRSRINESLVETSGVTLSDLFETVVARRSANVSVGGVRTTSVSRGAVPGAVGEALRTPETSVVSVDADPSYLTLAAVDHDRVPAVDPGREFHPLAAQNWNVFTMPYGNVVNSVVDSVAGELLGEADGIAVRSGALALARANQTLANRSNATLRRYRDHLQDDLSGSIDEFRDGADGILDRRTSLDAGEREAAITAALERWNSTHGRVLAVVNNSAAAAIAAEAARRGNLSVETADEIHLWLKNAFDLGAMSAETRPPRVTVGLTDGAARRISTGAVKNAITNRLEDQAMRYADRWYGRSLSRVPAGMPVVPVTGPPLFTFNAWEVAVRGTYARFTVRAAGSPSTGPDATVAYTRDGDPVSLDVDGDGTPERLGRSTRVRFSVETWVVVAVPPAGGGVGDVDGVAVERSPGWPCAGAGDPHECATDGSYVQRIADAFERIDASNESGEWHLVGMINGSAASRTAAPPTSIPRTVAPRRTGHSTSVSGTRAPRRTGHSTSASGTRAPRTTAPSIPVTSVPSATAGVPETGRQSLYPPHRQERVCSTRRPTTSRRRPRTSARSTPRSSPR